jgi:hypothetical protein
VVALGDEGFGGGIYCVGSQLLIDSSQFDRCHVGVAGARGAVPTDVVCRNSYFYADGSLFSGGALMIAFSVDSTFASWGSENVLFIGNSSFCNYSSREMSGAVEITGVTALSMAALFAAAAQVLLAARSPFTAPIV